MDYDIKNVFGGQIRYWRIAAGWTQEELASHSGLHKNYIGKVERGGVNPTLESMAKIAGGLKRPISGLFPAQKTGLHKNNGDACDYVRPLVRLIRGSSGEQKEYVLSALKCLVQQFKHKRQREEAKEGNEKQRIPTTGTTGTAGNG